MVIVVRAQRVDKRILLCAQMLTLIPLVAMLRSAVAQAERQRILERTNEGRIEAKANGIKFGRKPTIDNEKIKALHQSGIGATDIARQLGIGRSTVYKSLNQMD